MSAQDQAREALARYEAEKNTQDSWYWVGYLKAELARLIDSTAVAP